MSSDLVPFDESLMPAEQPAELAQIQLDERHMRYAQARWPDASEKMQQYRVRQAIWVRFENRKPHPEDPGRRMLGGPQPGAGRKSDKALGAAIVEHFEGRQKEVLDAIAAPLDEKNDPMDRHKAGMNIAKHAREEAKNAREADAYARQTDDEVRRKFAKMLADAVRSGEISIEDIVNGSGDIVDADVVPDEPQQIAS